VHVSGASGDAVDYQGDGCRCVIPKGSFKLDDEGRADYLTGDAEAT
jgi:hypothetical protein